MAQGLKIHVKEVRNLRILVGSAAVIVGCMLAGCSTITQPPSINAGGASQVNSGNLEVTLKENQKAITEGKGSQDVALYNIGVVSAHSLDYLKALQSFKTLVKNHPTSPRAEPAKVWIQALEQMLANAEEKQKLADEKRALAREREQLAQERNKLNYEIEKSRQLDDEIEQRRRSLKR